MIDHRRALIHAIGAALALAARPPLRRHRHRIGQTSRFATSLISLRAARPTSWRARSAKDSAQRSASRSWSRTSPARGSIGAAELARAAPDGYTIGAGTISSHAINATLYDKLSYDPVTSFAPITMYATQPNVLLVHPSVPAKNLTEFIALLKASPNKYAFGSAGNGTSQHISGELFKVMAGVSMQHIPYRGSGQMMPELLGGTLPVAFDNIATAVQHVNAGSARACGDERHTLHSVA